MSDFDLLFVVVVVVRPDGFNLSIFDYFLIRIFLFLTTLDLFLGKYR